MHESTFRWDRGRPARNERVSSSRTWHFGQFWQLTNCGRDARGPGNTLNSMDLLSKIVASKRLRIEAAKRNVPPERMRQTAEKARADATRRSLSAALNNEGINIVAEFKRRSPSKGVIREDADAAKIARSYESAGAAAISVLTEEDFFDGSLDDLRAVRAAVSIPILRKDFIVDECQS